VKFPHDLHSYGQTQLPPIAHITRGVHADKLSACAVQVVDAVGLSLQTWSVDAAGCCNELSNNSVLRVLHMEGNSSPQPQPLSLSSQNLRWVGCKDDGIPGRINLQLFPHSPDVSLVASCVAILVVPHVV
jgi:hypothetical protein